MTFHLKRGLAAFGLVALVGVPTALAAGSEEAPRPAEASVSVAQGASSDFDLAGVEQAYLADIAVKEEQARQAQEAADAAQREADARAAEEAARQRNTPQVQVPTQGCCGPHSNAWWQGVAMCEQGGRNDPYFGYFSFMDGSAGGKSWDEQVAMGNALLARAGREIGPWAESCVRAGYNSSPSG